MAASQTGRSRERWRDQGYVLDSAEQIFRNAGKSRRKDLYGFVDLVALGPDGDEVWIQVTTRGQIQPHIRKLMTKTTGKGQWAVPIKECMRRAVAGGTRLVIEGWYMEGGRWKVEERWITLEELQ